MMKVRTSVVVAILTLVAGFLMIYFAKSITSAAIVKTGAVIFLAAGVFNAVLSLMLKNPDGSRKAGSVSFFIGMVVSLGAVALGICMLFLQAKFEPLIPLVFSILVLLGALMLFYFIAIGARPFLMPGWLYLFPVAMLALAVVIFVRRAVVADSSTMIYAGSAMLVYAVGSLLVGIILAARRRRRPAVASAEAAPSATKDAPSTSSDAPASPSDIKSLRDD